MKTPSAFSSSMYLFIGLVGAAWPALADGPAGSPLPGTQPLAMGDIANALVAGVDRFLLRQIEQSTARRARYWKRDLRRPRLTILGRAQPQAARRTFWG